MVELATDVNRMGVFAGCRVVRGPGTCDRGCAAGMPGMRAAHGVVVGVLALHPGGLRGGADGLDSASALPAL